MINPWKNVSTDPSSPDGQMDKKALFSDENRQWKWKNSRKISVHAQINPLFVGIWVLSTILSTVLTVQQVFFHIPDKALITAWLLVFAESVGLDPLNAFKCFLSSITRVLGTMSCGMIIMVLWVKSTRLLWIAVIMVIINSILVICFNNLWLRSENWLHTDAVQHALTADPENESGRAWQGWGKRSCRTLYGQCGYPIDDLTIDSYAKPVFYLVYVSIKKHWKDNTSEMEKSKEEVTKLESEVGRLNDTIEILDDNLSDKNLDIMDDIRYKQELRDKIEELELEIAKLQMANEELVAKLPDPELEKPVPAEPDDKYLYMTTDERVQELLLRKVPYREIERITGLSKSAVSNRKKKMKEGE